MTTSSPSPNIAGPGNKLTDVRIVNGLSQEDLANYLNCGRNHICQIETGRRIPSLAFLEKLLEVLGVDTPEEIGFRIETQPRVVRI